MGSTSALAALDPDPRLAAAVAQALISCPFALERADELRALYGVAFDLLCSDLRQAEVLAKALEEPQARAGITRAGLREVLPALIARCQRVKSKLTPSEADAWRALTTPQAPEKPRADEAVLLQQVLDHQHDDTARQVYADALTERGDPRGEFIALQLAGSGSLQTTLKRQRALLKQHQAEWLGPLHRVFTHHVFHRGFLFEAALAHNAKAEPAVWQQALVHPELRFLRRLSQGRGSTAAYLGFLDAPGCNQVTEITGDGVLSSVLGQPQRPWRSLSLRSAPSLEGLKALTTLRSLRNLTIEHLADAQFPANLRKSGLLEQLTSLEFDWSHFAAELVALIGLGALRRITFTAFHSCITVTKSRANGFVVEGETEAVQLAKDLLEAVGTAEQVHLAITDYQPAENRLAWFDSWLPQHATHHTLHKLPKTDGAGFHERLRIALATER